MSESRVVITADAGRAVAEFRRFREQAVGALEQVSTAGGIIGGVLGAVGASLSVAAFTGWIKGAIDATDAASDLSQRIGVSVEDLAGLELAFQMGGMEASALEGAMTKLSKQIVDGNDAFSKLGLNSKNLDGSFKSNKDMLYELADRFAAMEEGVEKVALAQEVFGKSGAAMLPLLNGGAEGLREMDEMARQLGLSLNEEAVEQAGAFNDTLDLLMLGTQGVARGVAAELLPTLTSLAGAFLTTMTKGDSLRNTAQFLASGLKLLYTVGVGIVEVFSTVGKTIGAAGAQLVALVQGEFRLAAEIGRQWQADIGDSWAETARSIAAAWNTSGDASVEQMASIVRHGSVVGKSAAEIALETKKMNQEQQAQARLLAELSGLSGTFADDWSRLSDLYAKGAISLAQLEQEQAKLLAKQPAMKAAAEAESAAQKVLADFQKEYIAAMAITGDLHAKRVQDAEAEAVRNEELARTYGLTKSAIEQLELTRLEDQLAQRASYGLTLTEIETLEKLIDAKRRSIGAMAQMEGIDAATKAGEDLAEFLDPTRAQTFGEALKGAFGAAGDSLTQLVTALDAFGIRQAGIDKARQDAAIKYAKDSKGFAAASIAISEEEVKSRLTGYGDMASAAKGFFAKNSAGYKLLEGAEKTFRAFELASQMQSLYTHLFVTTSKAAATATGQGVETAAVVAGEAARNTAKVPGVFMSFMSALGPWGMAAAAAAIAAVLGGAFSGGSSVSLSQQRQQKQGTGSVFGDDTAKSESIINSLEAVKDNTYQGLAISQGMLSALTAIKNSIGNFAALVVRNDSITGTAQKFAGMDGGESNFLSKLGNSIFGGKKTLEDTGFTMKSLSYADVLNGKVDAASYADIKKKGGWFSSDKMSTQLEGLGQEGNRQIANVITSLGDAVKSAGSVLGLSGDEFNSRLNSFVVDIGKISFKGMKPDEIEKELQAVFSKLGDEMAQWGVAGLEQFQQVGEGYLETLTRVVTNYQAVTVVTDSLGMTFGALGLASVGARERLIDLVGGLDEFTSSAEQFLSDFYTDQERADSLRARITPTLEQFGIKTGAEDSLQQFRSVVTGLDLTTESGARAYATLMQIAPAFKQIADIDAGIFEERAELQSRIDELTMSSAEYLAKQRDAVHESNRALWDHVQALEAQSTAVEDAKNVAAGLMDGVDAAFSVLQKVVGRQKQALQEEIAIRSKSIQQIESLSQALRSALSGAPVGRDAEDRQAAQQQIQTALAIAKASGVLPKIDDLRGALSVVGKDSAALFATQNDYLRDFYATRAGIEDLAGLTDDALSVEERGLKQLEGQVQQLDLMLDRAQEQIDVLKGISITGLSIEQALQTLQGVIAAASANPVNAASSAISDAYKAALGRAPDQAGLDYWTDRAAGGTPTNAIVDAIKNSPEAKIQALYKDVLGRTADAAGLSYWMERLKGGISLDAIRDTFQNSDEATTRIPGFASGGDHSGGWRIVGENGPELEATGPARIFNAGQTRDLMSRLAKPSEGGAMLATEIRSLRAEVARLQAAMNRGADAAEQTAQNTGQFAEQFENASDGGNVLRVEVIGVVKTKEVV